MSITYTQATALRSYEHLTYFSTEAEYSYFEQVGGTNADGTPTRWRRNGATKTWKTRPGHFRIPVKHGLYDYGYITHENASQFRVAE